jgi:hypothetical protein
MDVVDILNNDGAQWENIITDNLRHLRRYRMAAIPYRIIWETGKIIKEHCCLEDNELNHAELREYLNAVYFPSVLKPTEVPHQDFIDLFFYELCQMIEQCSLRKLEDDGNMVWIFRIIGDPTTTLGNTSGKDKRVRVGFIALPSEYNDLMGSIYQTLDQSANCENKENACLKYWRDLRGHWTKECINLENNNCSAVLQMIQSKEKPSKKKPLEKSMSQMTSSKATPLEQTRSQKKKAPSEIRDTKLLIEYLVDQVVDVRREYQRSGIKTLMKSLLKRNLNGPILPR